MFNQFNPYGNPIDRIDNQIKELNNLKNTYQNIPHQQPMNVFNVGNASQIEFEARILKENEKPDEIPIQRRTMFFDPKNGVLSIKELNGEIVNYDVILPKTPEQLKIEELEKQNKELLSKLEEKESNKRSGK